LELLSDLYPLNTKPEKGVDRCQQDNHKKYRDDDFAVGETIIITRIGRSALPIKSEAGRTSKLERPAIA